MKNYLLLFSIISFCQPVLSADLGTLKLDAAKRASCSKSTPCSVNTKGYDGTYVVKINTVTITEGGIININHSEFRRFVYDATGKFLNEISDK